MMRISWDKGDKQILLLEYINSNEIHATESHSETVRNAVEMATELFVAVFDYHELDSDNKGLFDLIMFAKECIKSPLYSGHLVVVSRSNRMQLMVPQLSNFTRQLQFPQDKSLKWIFAPNIDYARNSANASIEQLKSKRN